VATKAEVGRKPANALNAKSRGGASIPAFASERRICPGRANQHRAGMCGRYRIKDTDRLTKEMRERFNIPDWVTNEFAGFNTPRYNIGPGQDIGALVQDADGRIKGATLRWGYVPYWETEARPKVAPINARSEEAFDKGMFRQSIQRRRCLVPADGFYEWRRLDDGKTKLPFDIHLKGERPFVMAGIYESATPQRPSTCLLFTTGPNELMSPIHDRMPVILEPAEAAAWLERGEMPKDKFATLMKPHSATDMEAIPISTLVNSIKNEGPEVLTPASHPSAASRPIKKSDLQGELELF
jgi:putative SOS response-associated peptidase YedK